MALPFLALIGLGFLNKFESDRTHAMSLLQARRSTAEQLVNNYLGQVKLMLSQLDRLPATRDFQSPRLKEACQQFLALHPEFINVAVIDRAGNLLYSTLTAVTNPPQNFAKTAPLIDILDTRDFKVSNAALGITTHRWGCAAAIPMSNQPGLLLAAAFDLNKLSEQLFLAPDEASLIVTVVDHHNTVVLSSLTPTARIGQKRATASPIAEALAAGRSSGEFTAVDGVVRTYDAGSISATGWLITAALPTKEVYRDAWRNLLSALGTILVVIILSTLFVIYYARNIARPIAALADAARAQADGRSEVLALVAGPREIAATANAFNDMIRARQESVSTLRRTEGRLDLALEGAELGLWEWHIPSGHVTFNARWTSMLEYNYDEVEPSLAAWEKLLHPDDKA